METTFIACTPSQLAQLRKELPIESIDDFAKTIQEQAMKFLNKLEANAQGDDTPQTTNGTSRQKPLTGGFGTRALKWKKNPVYSGSNLVKAWDSKRMWELCKERNIDMPACPPDTRTNRQSNSRSQAFLDFFTSKT